MRASTILRGSAVLLVLGGAAGIVAFFVTGEATAGIVGAVLLSSGILDLALSKWVDGLTKGLPKAPTFSEAAGSMSFALRMESRRIEREKLRGSGVPVEIELVSARDTGQVWNLAPIYACRVVVRAEGRPPVEADVEDVVPLYAKDRLLPGSRFPGHAPPEDLAKAAVDW